MQVWDQVVFHLVFGFKQIDRSSAQSTVFQSSTLDPHLLHKLLWHWHAGEDLKHVVCDQGRETKSKRGRIFPQTLLLTNHFTWHDLVSCCSYRAWSELSIMAFPPSLPPRRAGRAEANARKEHKLFIIPRKLYITTTSKLPSFVYFHIYE